MMSYTDLETKEYDNGIGSMIRKRRIAFKISQETLCSGICSRTTLCKVEHGVVEISAEKMAQLLERLGLSSDIQCGKIIEADYLVRQLIREANQYKVSGDSEKARDLLDEIRKDYDDFSNANKQRFDVLDSMLMYEPGELGRLYCLEKALMATVKNYSSDNLPELMTNLEVQILGDIANEYYFLGDINTAIAILYHIKKYLEEFVVDKVSARERLIRYCYNLSKFLGMVGRYNECIDVAYSAIDYCEYIQNYNMLPLCMYNCAWALVRRNRFSDRVEARRIATEALELCTSRTWNGNELMSRLKKIFDEDCD